MTAPKLEFTVTDIRSRDTQDPVYAIRISIGDDVMFHGRFATTQDAEDFAKKLIDNLTFTLSSGNKPT